MSYEIPDDCRYQDSHEWVRPENGTVTIGISDFAQDELGDVVFVELPDEGATLEAGTDFGVVESIKAVSDVYAPVSGTVTGANDDLVNTPELLNEDPYGDGWMIEVELADEAELDDLLSPEEYAAQIE